MTDAPSAQPALRVRTLVAGYGTKVVLRDVSFDVRAGEIVALLGLNGAGKSTCFRTIVGQRPPLSGTVMLDDVDASRRGPSQNARDGLVLVPEGARSFPDLSVRENLDLCRFAVRDAAAFRERLEEATGTFPRLGERLNERAGTLSGGERQMLAIARALIMRPRILLLDEPFLGLAPIMINEVVKQLARLKASIGCAILVAEQNVAATLRVADRVLLVRGGLVEVLPSGVAQDELQGLLLGA
jgi:branched-chain amino acid transport system ATP-binding protein